MAKGWRNEPLRHSLARKGVKTGRKQTVKNVRILTKKSDKQRVVFVRMADGEIQGYIFPNQAKADMFVDDLSDKKRYPNIEVIKQVG